MIFFKTSYQNNSFLGNGGPSKISYFSLLNYFGFIDVNWTVYVKNSSGLRLMYRIVSISLEYLAGKMPTLYIFFLVFEYSWIMDDLSSSKHKFRIIKDKAYKICYWSVSLLGYIQKALKCHSKPSKANQSHPNPPKTKKGRPRPLKAVFHFLFF